MPTPRWWLILWAIMVAGCESTPRVPDHPVAPVDIPVSVNELTPPTEEREPVPIDVWTVLRDGFALNHATSEPSVARAVGDLSVGHSDAARYRSTGETLPRVRRR